MRSSGPPDRSCPNDREGCQVDDRASAQQEIHPEDSVDPEPFRHKFVVDLWADGRRARDGDIIFAGVFMRGGLMALSLLAGCTTHAPCAKSSALVTVTFDAASSRADQLDVTLSLDGGAAQMEPPIDHTPGQTQGTIEIDFTAGYPVGRTLTIQITARSGGVVVGAGSAMPVLTAGCTAGIDLAVHGTGDDLGVPDLNQVDLSNEIDLEADDLTESSDLELLPDLGSTDLAMINHGPGSDVAENVLATWDVGESASDTPVPCNPMNLGHVTLTADTSTVKAGAQAVNIAYISASYFQAVYPKGLGASWDLTTRTGLEVWIEATEPVDYAGWSPPGPTLILCGPSGAYREISPSSDQLGATSSAYTRFLIPLSTGGIWTSSDVGGFSLSKVNWFELHFDPSCGTCTISSLTVRIDDAFFY
jgi:hypothetical protein